MLIIITHSSRYNMLLCVVIVANSITFTGSTADSCEDAGQYGAGRVVGYTE